MSETSQSSEGSGATAPVTAATAGAAEIVKRSRGRPKGTANGTSQGAGSGGGLSPELAAKQAELQAQFDRLYDPKVWRGIVAAPANIALAVTGNNIWDLPDNEVDTLAIQASVTARCFAVSDPKWLALTMLSISIITTYGSRAAQYFMERAEKKISAENNPPK